MIKRILKMDRRILTVGFVCFAAVYGLAIYFWCARMITVPSPPAERKVMWTGNIAGANGWQFKLANLCDLGKISAKSVVFSPRTRQLFIGFDESDNGALYQWDIDKTRLVSKFILEQGFSQHVDAISPDGRHLIVTGHAQAPLGKTSIVSVDRHKVVAELGNLGTIYECRFSADGSKVCLWTGATYGPVAFEMDGTRVKNFHETDFEKNQKQPIFYVPVSKTNTVDYGLFLRDGSGAKHLLTKNCWNWGFDDSLMAGKVIVAPSWNDDIVFWDAASAKEIARQRITNHHDGAGYMFYDALKDRFLIVDPSYQGTAYLRTLSIAKRPPSR
jgi:hypothetical protein